MGAEMDRRLNATSQAEVGASTTRISDSDFSDLTQKIRQALRFDADEDVRAILLDNLVAAHDQWETFRSKYNLTVTADGTAQFSIPGNLTAAEGWNEFRKDMNMGDGGEAFGFDEVKAPNWFPKNSEEMTTLGSNLEIFGANLTRQEQLKLFEQQGLWMGSIEEGVEALVAQQFRIAHSNENLYQGLTQIARELNKPIISEEVFAKWESMKLEEFIRRIKESSADGWITIEETGLENISFIIPRSNPESDK